MTREQAHQGIITLFKGWQQETEKAFEDWFNEESASFGHHILSDYYNYHKKKLDVFKGFLEPTLENLLPTLGVEIVETVIDSFKSAGVKDKEIEDKVLEYFYSSALKEIPFVKMWSMLIAALARKAAAGQQKYPDQGTLYDFSINAPGLNPSPLGE